jgi:hypothetical protein
MIATIGLSFDIIGAILAAIGIVRAYRGQITSSIMGQGGEPTQKYNIFERQNRIIGASGLFLLLIGFILQILALWI